MYTQGDDKDHHLRVHLCCPILWPLWLLVPSSHYNMASFCPYQGHETAFSKRLCGRHKLQHSRKELRPGYKQWLSLAEPPATSASRVHLGQRLSKVVTSFLPGVGILQGSIAAPELLVLSSPSPRLTAPFPNPASSFSPPHMFLPNNPSALPALSQHLLPGEPNLGQISSKQLTLPSFWQSGSSSPFKTFLVSWHTSSTFMGSLPSPYILPFWTFSKAQFWAPSS